MAMSNITKWKWAHGNGNYTLFRVKFEFYSILFNAMGNNTDTLVFELYLLLKPQSL